MLKRFTTDFTVVSNCKINSDHFLLTLRHPDKLQEVRAGQFVEVKIPDSQKTFLRRPISIHDVNYEDNSLCLLIRNIGHSTGLLSKLQENSVVNLVYPLGNGFSRMKISCKPLLIGGGVGIAPLYYLAKQLLDENCKPEVLLGARNQAGLLRIHEFEALGTVHVTTEDGSVGTKGFVTDHFAMNEGLQNYTHLYVCGPTPMMKAVARKADEAGIDCEVSLENKMACGIGVCLCCVTDTIEGHKCVCSDGPVFNSKDLKW